MCHSKVHYLVRTENLAKYFGNINISENLFNLFEIICNEN